MKHNGFRKSLNSSISAADRYSPNSILSAGVSRIARAVHSNMLSSQGNLQLITLKGRRELVEKSDALGDAGGLDPPYRCKKLDLKKKKKSQKKHKTMGYHIWLCKVIYPTHLSEYWPSEGFQSHLKSFKYYTCPLLNSDPRDQDLSLF